MTFEWIDVPHESYTEEHQLTLHSRLMSARAKRKILGWKIDDALTKIQQWEIDRSMASDKEDRLMDEIERRRI